MWRKLATTRRLCLFVFVLTLLLDLGQGILRYRRVIGLTGEQFIDLTEFDARLHVTIAQRILNGQGFTIPVSIAGGPVEVQPAFTKAPGYPYLLAALFRITGISFSFFPLQCLCGALLSVLVVLISMELFDDPLAALIAGLGAAFHPVLINSASQLYNENLYFCLFFLVLWLYLRWMEKPSVLVALLCGLVAGVTALLRELIVPPFAALILLALVWMWPRDKRRAVIYAASLSAGLLIPVIPWTIRNYLTTGALVPISAISGYAIGAGNSSCVSGDSWTTPFYGDSPCPALDKQREALVSQWNREPRVVFNDRAYMVLGLRFIREHVPEYLKLCFRRAWTVFDPVHPHQQLQGGKKLMMLLYFLTFVFPGMIGGTWLLFYGAPYKAFPLYVSLVASYLPLAFLFVSHDHRYAIGIHLTLGIFAGGWMAHFFRGTASFARREVALS